MTPIALLLLYIATRVKHFICDFLLQSRWMALFKGIPGREGNLALLSHALVHGAGMFIVLMIFAASLWWIALVDILVHGAIDWVKGRISYKKQWTASDRGFWLSIGLDQEAHNLTHLAYIIVIIIASGGLIL